MAATGKPRPKRAGGAEGRSWRRLVAQIVVRDRGRCWICFHLGAHSADHLIPETEGGPSTPGNLKAVHAYPKGCGVCTAAAGKPIYCNEIRQYGSVERARRKIEERTGLRLGEAPYAPEGRELLLIPVVLRAENVPAFGQARGVQPFVLRVELPDGGQCPCRARACVRRGGMVVRAHVPRVAIIAQHASQPGARGIVIA
jgi:hypothetical protein